MNEVPQPDSALYFTFGTPISRDAAVSFNLVEVLKTAYADPEAARSLLLREASLCFNQAAPEHQPPAETIRTGDLMALDTLQDILRFVIDDYCLRQQPGALTRGRDWLRGARPAEFVERAANAFVVLYPPGDGSLAEGEAADFIEGSCADRSAADVVAREEVLLHLATANVAAESLSPLFNDQELLERGQYDRVVSALGEYFDTQPAYDHLDMTLFQCLRAPMEASPNSLEGQLEYVRTHWAKILPAELFERLDVVTGVLAEEALERGVGEPQTIPLRFGAQAPDTELYPEYERFSDDADWMSNVVLIAKLAYVWLDQLSKTYGRSITRLDEVPDEELDQLASRGFTGLWLIGVWERSRASEMIKKRMGNLDAAASAYSLFDYTIAEDLGGLPALENLKDRARRRGIRLASDMVPNHVGVFSRWVVDHPDWFLQSDTPPFPAYQFNGPDLSPDDQFGVYIEDGYWDKQDAAVVFKRVDHRTGDVRYVYHGNDGTHMPWNDTAQLNYLVPDVREAVIQNILHVASLFPIIRFDAAMTLTKKHYQRLWFPMPGDAGAIPSRAENSMSKQEFDSLMPLEFWREVVDRAATDAPDTLLLAEAFWLMEGYFVRTLGMHRVYNSAFMNMIKMEENDKYRETIKNVLAFSPEILKRFVNFMNNPDERTAVEQFGKGDKYFGATVLMATLPGLPMFGHGQVEGFEEKYGMEFRRAYQDETIDDDLVRRHEREIFPLLKKRYLFSGVSNFALYDFFAGRGRVNENVLAFSNQAGEERSLVLYNNSLDATAGWIRTSVPMRGASEDEPKQPTLAEAMGLQGDADAFYIIDEHHSGQVFLRGGKELSDKGLYVQLDGYAYHVFLGFREVRDEDGSWAKLAKHLNGKGVANIDEAYAAYAVAPQINAFRGVMNGSTLHRLALISAGTGRRVRAMQWHMARGLKRLWKSIESREPLSRAIPELVPELDAWRSAFRRASKFAQSDGEDKGKFLCDALDLDVKAEDPPIAHSWLMLRIIATGFEDDSGDWIDRWHFAPALAGVFAGKENAEAPVSLVRSLLRFSLLKDEGQGLVNRWFDDDGVRELLQYHEYDGVHYVNKERLTRWVYSTVGVSVVCALRSAENKVDEEFVTAIEARYQWAHDLLATAEDVLYQVEEFLAIVDRMPSIPPLLVPAQDDEPVSVAESESI
jgi:glycosidase